jgi:hypothetical protein
VSLNNRQFRIEEKTFDLKLILSDNLIFIDMGKLNKKIVVRITQRQLEYLVEETLKQNKSMSQVVRKALVELFIKKI